MKHTPETIEAIKHCVRVMRSCKNLEQLNMAYKWAVGAMVITSSNSQPCSWLYRLLAKLLPGFMHKLKVRRTVGYVQRLIRIRNHLAKRVLT